MRLADYLEKGSLWEGIRGLAPLPVFDTHTPESLDNQTDLFYGHRTMFSRMEGLTIEQMSQSIVLAYNDKWVNLIAAHALGLDIGEGSVKVTDTSGKKLDTADNTSEVTRKVSAYNSDELISDTGNDNSSTERRNSEQTGLSKSSEKSVKNAFDNLNLLTQYHIINTMVGDVANHMTLSVY